MNQAVAASYRACHQVVRRSGSNFALAFWLLPRDKRLAMDALYAFARFTDDLGDDGHANVIDRSTQLQAWHNEVRAALAGQPTRDRLLPALVDTAQRFAIPHAIFDDLIQGVQRDLVQTRYPTWGELQSYCYQVAGTVGVACLYVWEFRGERPLELAKTCGQAFQLTNILRDVAEDAARGRYYLPEEDLARFHYTCDDLRRGVADQRFDQLMDFELARAEQLYATAAPMHDDLSRDGQRVFRLMFGRYQGILAAIRRRPRDVLRRRISLSLPSKLWIAGRKLLAAQP